MIKKLLNGLVFGTGFGTGFGIAVVIVIVIYFQFFFEPMKEDKISVTNSVVNIPPSIEDSKRFLGSPAIFSGDFDNKDGVLSSGPGKIVGKVTKNGDPVPGLRLRLALNNSIMSQWAITDNEGMYEVSVK